MSPAGAGTQAAPRWLTPLGWIYRVGAALRNGLYDLRVLPSRAASLPVIAIGALVFGGAGKTPAAMWLTGLLADRGFRVGLVSRGYGGRRTTDPLLVSRRGETLASQRQAGDEPMLMARESRAHVVVVGRRRAAAAMLAQREGASLVVLDDGFQHRSLRRDVDVVLVGPGTAAGRHPLHAADFLREGARGLRRAHLILVTGGDPSAEFPARFLDPSEVPRSLAAVLASLPAAQQPRIAGAVLRPSTLTLPGGERAAPSALSGRTILAVSGIARPSAFRDTLDGLNANVAAHMTFPDHHRYTPRDGAAIARRLRAAGAEVVVTTAKDLMRWPDGAPSPAVLGVELIVPSSPAISDWLLTRVGGPSRG